MSISCKCLNVVIKLGEPEAESLPQFDLEKYLHQKRSHQPESATAKLTPSDDHFLFFKEALGPVQCSTIQIQFDGLLRITRVFDEWDLMECRNCNSCVYAQNTVDATPSDRCLVNSTLMTNQEQLSDRLNDINYSHAFNIILDRSNLTYSDLAKKSKFLNKAQVDNKFVRLYRAYMEQETEAANERIQRFTEQESAVLKVKRERAEEECIILSKLENKVPELLHNISSSSSNSNINNSTSNDRSADTVVQPIMTTNPITRAIGLSSNSVSPMVTTGVPTNLNDTNGGSQLETPPPTPEYLPMSTGNSPPMTSAANNRQQAITPSSSSSMSTIDQQGSYPSPNGKLSGTKGQSKSNLNYNGNNNNNIVSLNNIRGAMSNKQPPATAMMMTSTAHQHSSTNSILMQQQQRMTTATTSSFESDCMFDIDGMENDKSPLSNTLSDEEELGYDESSGNNNEDGIYIPSRQFGRQNSSIAKSLPISMPQVMTQFRTNDEDFEEMAEDNVDIAASIKALAKSVHGDTVFGDLPRPQIQRFSTQI